MIQTLKHNTPNMVMYNMTSSIQQQVIVEGLMTTFKAGIHKLVESFDIYSMCFAMGRQGEPVEVKDGIFQEEFTTTSINEALKNIRPGECIWIRGLESDCKRTYMVGTIKSTITECLEDADAWSIKHNSKIERVMEGGHVFDGGSDPIAKEDIPNTLDAWLKEIKRLFPKVAKYWDNPVTLGSVGKKDFSGDIDIAIDETGLKNPDDWGLDPQVISEYYNKMLKRARTSTPQQVMRRAIITAIADYINDNSDLITTNSKSAGEGMMFSQFGQIGADGKPNGKTVQIDTNFGNVDWLKFAYYSDSYAGNVKGLHRTQLLLHLFDAKGFMFKHNRGIMNKDTREWVAENPQEAIAKLNELYGFHVDEKTLQNYHKLQEFLRTNVDKRTLDHVYDIYLKTLDSTRCDIPEDLQPYWVENKDRLGLTGKFLPSTSQLAPLAK